MTQEAAKPSYSFKNRVFATIILFVIRVFGLTYRLRFSGRSEHLLDLTKRQGPVIMAVWHNRLFFFATYTFHHLLRKRLPMTLMTSASKDGEIGAILGEKAGAQMVRGSSSRRGAAGLMALYRSIVKQKHSIIMLPDGSKGPVYQAKVGVAALAKMTGAPILPMSCWASRYWRVRSWDRMIIPKPFARVEITVGDLIEVPRETDDEGLERIRLQVQEALDELGRAAERRFAPELAS